MSKINKYCQFPIKTLIICIIVTIVRFASLLEKRALKIVKNVFFVRSLFTADYNSTQKIVNPRKNAASQHFFVNQYKYD